jgi:hypothetical protein
VAAVTANDIWAVGSGSSQTLIEHWNGSAWSVVASPNVGSGTNILYSLTILSATNIWTVGNYTSGGFMHALIAQWNGSTWNVVASANGPAGDTDLRGVAAVSATDIWAIGYTGATTPEWVPYSEHWNGSAWSTQPTPNNTAVAHNSTGWGIAAVGPNDLWMVADDGLTLIEHYSDPCVAGTVTPTRTPGPATATPTVTATPPPGNTATATPPAGNTATATPPPGNTATRTTTPPPGATATATATTCVVTFSDVQPSDYFYTPVQYLACHGVVSGYSDGTFRPYNTTTRGQMSKIVVLGFTLAITTTGGPHFSDVPVGSTFYNYIETAYNRGIVGGYADGTFGPNNDVTRGQLSKMVVRAAGWSVVTPPSGHFSDVPPGSIFYTYVETAYCHAIVDGYSDGTFRPGSVALRGQMAKLVYLGLQSGAACSR